MTSMSFSYVDAHDGRIVRRRVEFFPPCVGGTRHKALLSIELKRFATKVLHVQGATEAVCAVSSQSKVWNLQNRCCGAEIVTLTM